MAKVVSDNLVVKMGGKDGETVHDLGALFNENPNRVISIVGTVNDDGSPNTAPMSLFFAPDASTIVAGMVIGCRTVENIKRESRVIVEVLFEGDVSFGVSGSARVIKEPLDSSNAMLAVRIDVEAIKKDTSPAQIVTSGPTSTPRSENAARFAESVWAEVAEIGKDL